MACSLPDNIMIINISDVTGGVYPQVEGWLGWPGVSAIAAEYPGERLVGGGPPLVDQHIVPRCLLAPRSSRVF
jgi:hypothetical protein